MAPPNGQLLIDHSVIFSLSGLSAPFDDLSRTVYTSPITI